MRSLFLTVGAVSLVVQVAFAQAPTDPQKLFLKRWRPPAGQRCSVTNGQVPPPYMVFDTTALGQLVSKAVRGSIVLAYLPNDTNWLPDFGPRPDSMTVIESTLSDSQTKMLRDVMLQALKPPIDMAILIRLALKDRSVLQVAPALQCPPILTNQTDLRRYSTALDAVAGQPRRTVFRLLVRPDGTPTDIAVLKSSGSTVFDQAALSVVSLAHFNPGLINRVPVAAVVQIPLSAGQFPVLAH